MFKQCDVRNGVCYVGSIDLCDIFELQFKQVLTLLEALIWLKIELASLQKTIHMIHKATNNLAKHVPLKKKRDLSGRTLSQAE